MKRKILIFIVTYQSSFRVMTIIKKLKKIGKNKDLYKILISDDNSTDDTINYIKKIQRFEKVNTILNKKNIGYEASIIKGIKYILKNSKYTKYIATLDADGELLPKFIPILLKKSNSF